ncbi:MAG: MBL fold metallo-hydrolase [Rhodocyclaceae bacterium]|nr:MBL fold metallo-hydrolase [Rhodocyclaceae bacterium]
MLTHFADGIHAFDSGYGRPMLDAIHLIEDAGRVAIVDTASNASVPRVLAALAELGRSVEAVDYLLLTHIHLDHAGGAGALMARLPTARLVVHPRGVRHMADPAKLWAGTVAVYGEAQATRLYGELVPVPAERIVAADDGLELPLGARTIEVLDTPGHARHHVCYFDRSAQSFFTGDTFGLSYRELDVDGRASIWPTTTPVQFDPQAMHASIDRMLARRPVAMYLTHFSRVDDVPRLAADLHRLIDEHVRIAEAAEGEGEALTTAIEVGLRGLLQREAERQGWTLPAAQLAALMAMDLALNAQGLAVWLASRQPAAV